MERKQQRKERRWGEEQERREEERKKRWRRKDARLLLPESTRIRWGGGWEMRKKRRGRERRWRCGYFYIISLVSLLLSSRVRQRFWHKEDDDTRRSDIWRKEGGSDLKTASLSCFHEPSSSLPRLIECVSQTAMRKEKKRNHTRVRNQNCFCIRFSSENQGV